MRQIQVFVTDDDRESVLELLDDEGVDYVRQRAWVDGETQWLLSFPVPTDAIGHFLDRLDGAGVDVDRYTVITSVESAMTSRADTLVDRFASDFDPLSHPELRSKARDMSRDPRSFLALIALSAVIATAGLLTESIAVVVGSMVIAPIVGPVLTAAVGALTGDREMLIHSVWIQAGGLGLAIVAAAAFGAGVQAIGFVPRTLDITSLDPIAVRVAPGLLTVAVAIAAGAASAFGLATKGPTSLIGVMIAAALIPAAATVGIAVAWTEPRVAVGSLLLLMLSITLINVGAFLLLSQLGYGTDRRQWRLPSSPDRGDLASVGTALALLVVVGVVLVGSYQQIAFERSVNQEVEAVLGASEYESLEPVAVRIQYAGMGPFVAPETITVTASWTGDGRPPDVAGALARRVHESTGEDVGVWVRILDYQRAVVGRVAPTNVMAGLVHSAVVRPSGGAAVIGYRGLPILRLTLT